MTKDADVICTECDWVGSRSMCKCPCPVCGGHVEKTGPSKKSANLIITEELFACFVEQHKSNAWDNAVFIAHEIIRKLERNGHLTRGEV